MDRTYKSARKGGKKWQVIDTTFAMAHKVAQCPPFERPQSFSERFERQRALQGAMNRVLHFWNEIHTTRDGIRTEGLVPPGAAGNVPSLIAARISD